MRLFLLGLVLATMFLLACSRLDVRNATPFKEILLEPLAKEREQSAEQYLSQLLKLEGKTAVLLPVYFENLDTSNSQLNIYQEAEKFMRDLRPPANYHPLPPRNLWPEAIRTSTAQYQKDLYEIGISDRNLSADIGKYFNSQNLYLLQIDYWPLFAVDEKKQSERLEMQLRLVDSSTGIMLWHGIKRITVDAEDGIDPAFHQSLKDLFESLWEDRWAKK